MYIRLFAQLLNTALIILETLLTIRFFLKLFNISNSSGVVNWLYSTTEKVLSPFSGIVGNIISFLGLTIELRTLLALFILSIISYAVTEIIKTYTSHE
ncbi:YggT family protein [bacterium]|nr:YggT family protein [bacterium]